MIFDDRVDAGRELASALDGYRAAHPLILAIPRGAMPIGKIVADALSGELDVVLVRKLGAPYDAEFAVGSIGESGKIFIAAYAERVGADSRYIAEEAARQLAITRRRRAQYDQVHPSIGVAGRTVIVVDDGLATGSTMCAALQELRDQKPERLICAVPVASTEAVARVRPLCDALVCLDIEANFGGVAQFYRDFDQVEDDEVVRLLAGKS